MSRVVVYKIFIGGPSDVGSDLEVIKQAITDINLVSAPLGLHFEPFHWTENVTPGLSQEPQSRINDQASGYDALVSVIGARLGTPTKDHESGTVEEIENSIKSAEEKFFGLSSVMVFFKDVKLDTRSSDLDAALKVQIFRKSLGPKGVLFKDFGNEADLRSAVLRCFGGLIAIHMSKVSVGERVDEKDGFYAEKISKTTELSEFIEPEELGLLDYEFMFSELISDATSRSELIAKAMVDLGENIDKITADFGTANALGDRAWIANLVSRSASDMNACSQELEQQAPAITELFRSAYDAMRDAIGLQASDFNADHAKDSREDLKAQAIALSPVLEETRNKTIGFYDAVSDLPRLSKEMGSAKKRMMRALESVMSMYNDVDSRNNEILSYLNSFKE